jgi:hypothetical protein
MKRTITELEKTLADLRKGREKGKYEEGMFGIKECRKSIEWDKDFYKKSLHEIYCELISRCLKDRLANELMIIACEEMMKEEGEIEK